MRIALRAMGRPGAVPENVIVIVAVDSNRWEMTPFSQLTTQASEALALLAQSQPTQPITPSCSNEHRSATKDAVRREHRTPEQEPSAPGSAQPAYALLSRR